MSQHLKPVDLINSKFVVSLAGQHNGDQLFLPTMGGNKNAE
jgi:hypothetical protein